MHPAADLSNPTIGDRLFMGVIVIAAGALVFATGYTIGTIAGWLA